MPGTSVQFVPVSHSLHSLQTPFFSYPIAEVYHKTSEGNRKIPLLDALEFVFGMADPLNFRC
jgi:hypothetical protein